MNLDLIIILYTKNTATNCNDLLYYIDKYIATNDILFIVPDNDYLEIKNMLKDNNRKVKIKKDSNYLTDEELKGISKLRNMNWYKQQFIKIKALFKENYEFVLLWDGDTYPIKKIEFSKKDKVILRKGMHYHKEYFQFLLKFNLRYHGFSLIAQCMPIKKSWVDFLLKSNENICLDIIKFIDLNQDKGFSEFEFLGSFILEHFKHEIVVVEKDYIRNFKFKNQFIFKLLSFKYSYLSIEKW